MTTGGDNRAPNRAMLRAVGFIDEDFNKPMIVTNVGGLAEMCPNDKVGYVVNPNPDEIAGAILKFFDENKENTFIENIIEEKKKYTWEILMDNLLNLHENIK